MRMTLHGSLGGVGVYQTYLPFRSLSRIRGSVGDCFCSKRGAWVCSTTYFNPARFGTTHLTFLPS